MKINKFIAAVMALTIVGGSVPFISDIAPDTVITASAATPEKVTEGDFTFNVYDDHAELIEYSNNAETDVTIPSKVNGQAVTVIGDRVFNEKKEISSIAIPDSVTQIGNSAFYGTGIRKIVLPSKLKKIGGFAFQSNKKLASVSIPDGVEEIAKNAFAYCEVMTSLSLPNSLKVLGENAFSGCVALEEVTYPSSIEEAGDNIFFNCIAIKKVTFEKGVTEIPNGIFYMDNSNSVLDEITIPDGVKKIGDKAFYGTAIKKINIPSSVETIGDGAFWSCLKLGAVKIPSGISKIGKNTFRNCQVLVSVDLPSSIKYIDDSAFYVCDALEEITLPEGIIEINDSAFNGTGLKNVVLPESLEYLGKAFGGCKQLTGITILNPDCSIAQDENTICNTTWAPLIGRKYEGVIYGYENSSAQKYAERAGYDFNLIGSAQETTTTTTAATTKATTTTTTSTTTTTTTSKTTPSTPVTTTSNDTKYGDVNCDGVVDIEDATLLKSYLADAKIKISPQGLINADVYHPGLGLDEVDADFIMKSINGEASIPVMPKTSAPVQPTASFGDINGDDIIDGRDATMLLTYYAKTSTGYKGTLEQFAAEQRGDAVTTAAAKTTVTTTATTTAKTSVTSAPKTTILTFQVTGAGNPVLTTAVKVDDLNNVDDSWQQAALDEWLKNRQ